MTGTAGTAGTADTADTTSTTGTKALRSLARDRRFALLWTGQTISEFGSAVTTLAMPLIAVSTLAASAFQVSLVAAATSVAWLVVGLPAGAWVDRVRRRPVLIAADLGRALALATIPVAWAIRSSAPWSRPAPSPISFWPVRGRFLLFSGTRGRSLRRTGRCPLRTRCGRRWAGSAASPNSRPEPKRSRAKALKG